MKQIPNYGDERQLAFCTHCGGETGNKDHVVSKVFPDKPYPENLPIISICRSCNQGFSKDEEYLACLVECSRIGSVDVDDLEREKIKVTLRHTPALAARLGIARTVEEGKVSFSIEEERVMNVILKMARGHALFELNEPQIEEPIRVWYRPLFLLASDERRYFEAPLGSPVRFEMSGWPEVGSRAMVRLVEGFGGGREDGWIVVQPERYRYCVPLGEDVVVRLVISEYLGCEVTWSY